MESACEKKHKGDCLYQINIFSNRVFTCAVVVALSLGMSAVADARSKKGGKPQTGGGSSAVIMTLFNFDDNCSVTITSTKKELSNIVRRTNRWVSYVRQSIGSLVPHLMTKPRQAL